MSFLNKKKIIIRDIENGDIVLNGDIEKNKDIFKKYNIIFGKNFEIPLSYYTIILHKNIIIGDNVRIHDKVEIYSEVTIGNNVTISDNVTIFSNVIIGSNVHLRNDVNIHEDCIIGSNNTLESFTIIKSNIAILQNEYPYFEVHGDYYRNKDCVKFIGSDGNEYIINELEEMRKIIASSDSMWYRPRVYMYKYANFYNNITTNIFDNNVAREIFNYLKTQSPYSIMFDNYVYGAIKYNEVVFNRIYDPFHLNCKPKI